MRRHHPLRRQHQHGFALMMLLVIMTMGSLYLIVNALTPEVAKRLSQQKAYDSMQQARDALIQNAIVFREYQQTTGTNNAMYGLLPLPDLGETVNLNANLANATCTTEGCAKVNPSGVPATPTTYVGRFPWKYLGTEVFRDNNGECLWYAVSGNHKALNNSVVPMNSDTLGDISATALLNSIALSPKTDNDAPIALIISPGNPTGTQARTVDANTLCGGDYTTAHFLDTTNDTSVPITSDMLFSALRNSSNYRTDINTLLDQTTSCLRDTLVAGSSFVPTTITGYSAPSDKTAGRLPSNSCYGDTQVPYGYFSNYQEQLFVAKCNSGNCSVTLDANPLAVPAKSGTTQTCAGALIFSGPRNTTAGSIQSRATATEKATLSNYLEGNNLLSFRTVGTAFAGDSLFKKLNRKTTDQDYQEKYQDIVRCIPSTASIATAESSTLGANQLVDYDPGTRTLTLGKLNITSASGSYCGSGNTNGCNSSSLFGCAWQPETHALGKGFRVYFSFTFATLGTNVGSTGFTFAALDGTRNSSAVCGAAGSQLGYSGDNTFTAKVTYPKLGVEFDQSLNSGYGNTGLNPGRNDPDRTGATGCNTSSTNTHSAIVYWGHEATNAIDLVTVPDNDDNAHGFPTSSSLTGNSRKPPTNPTCGTTDPSSSLNLPGIKFFQDMRTGGYVWHARIETTPTRTVVPGTAELSYTTMHTEVWIERDGVNTDVITAMKNTSRPMSQVCDMGKKSACAAGTCPSGQTCGADNYCYLTPSCAAELSDTAKFYDVKESACGAGNSCPSNQTCGSDGFCYRQAMETVRLGFTGSQNTADQQVTISNFFPTWPQ